jgi:alpha-mannosidase
LERDENSICLINTLSSSYYRPVELPAIWTGHEVFDGRGKPVPVQNDEDHPVVLAAIRPLGSLTLIKGKKKGATFKKGDCLQAAFILENDLVRYEFSEEGTVIRAFDKECRREILSRGQEGNVLLLYEDRPANWDAWDIDIYYESQLRGRAELLSRRWVSRGPVREGIEVQFRVGNSDIRQRIYLAANAKRLDFETGVEWREDHKLLRVSFSAEVLTDTASFDVQFGIVKRPTHRNTSWDLAKFEAVGHRFADLSERGYGVALLNDGKYGYKVYGNEISLSLLRSPTMPDPRADRGSQSFIYSFLPHKGDLAESDVFREAAALNQKPARFEGYDGRAFAFPFALGSEEIVLETAKKAEREDALILRLYEPAGKAVETRLQVNRPDVRVFAADLVENTISRLRSKGKAIVLSFRPFEIKTLKIVEK